MPKDKNKTDNRDKSSPSPTEFRYASTEYFSAFGERSTLEANSYLMGLFQEFNRQMKDYTRLTVDLLGLEARIDLAEKTLCLTRDHFAMTVANTEDAQAKNWTPLLRAVRYVGVRLVDASAKSIREHSKMTPEELLRDLNDGMFRFRTNSPLREIHAALLRYPYVKREKGYYVWIAPPDAEQITMRLRVARRDPIAAEKGESRAETEKMPTPAVAS